MGTPLRSDADGRPMIWRFNEPITDEERQSAEELALKQETQRVEMRRRAAEADLERNNNVKMADDMMALRPANSPYPTQLKLWGNYFVGNVIPNVEMRHASGIWIPNDEECMSKPHACVVVNVSDELCETDIHGNKTPGFAALVEARSRIARGESSGLAVQYDFYAGKEWTDGVTGQRFVQLNPSIPMAITGSFDPRVVARSGHKITGEIMAREPSGTSPEISIEKSELTNQNGTHP